MGHALSRSSSCKMRAELVEAGCYVPFDRLRAHREEWLMPRYCLVGHVDPNRLEEYREAHRAVWPELLEALRDAGWRNYSLFLRDDGLLIGYAEADDLAVAQERVARTEVNTRWQAAMAELFQNEGAPDEAWEIIPEVFNLEDQLKSARADS